MDWVKTFYEKQHTWVDVYSGEVEAWHRDKAESIVLSDRKRPYRILELGCGGGQVALSLADLGHEVVAIDMNSDAIMNARRLADNRPHANITLVEGDFFSFAPNILFDAVCYFDGFGIGPDEDQQRLLQKITSWLSTGGRAFIEVYAPWYWQHIAGTLMEWPDACRKYGFDTAGSRLLDTWWATGHPDDTVTQSLRCYSPDDFDLLINGTGLDLVDIRPGGSYDHETKVFRPLASLKEAMQYMAIVEKR